jgi:hypothetical protein
MSRMRTVRYGLFGESDKRKITAANIKPIRQLWHSHTKLNLSQKYARVLNPLATMPFRVTRQMFTDNKETFDNPTNKLLHGKHPLR